MSKKRIVLAVIFLTLALVSTGYWTKKNYPPLQDGDLVFQTLTDSQSLVVMAATGSPYAHMGIIEKTPSGNHVIEALRVVEETPLQQWMSRGVLGRVAIYRYKNLTEFQERNIVTVATHYDGTPYDIYFSFKSKDMYCSKLPYLAYKEAGLPLGTLQTFSQLHMDNALVKKLIENRRHSFPDCADKDFTQCYDYIMQQPIITPASIAADTHLEKIYSNYSPF